MINEEQVFNEIINDSTYNEEFYIWSDGIQINFGKDFKYDVGHGFKLIEIVLDFDGISYIQFTEETYTALHDDTTDIKTKEITYVDDELDEFLKTPAGEKIRNHVKHVLTKNILK